MVSDKMRMNPEDKREPDSTHRYIISHVRDETLRSVSSNYDASPEQSGTITGTFDFRSLPNSYKVVLRANNGKTSN